MSDAVLRIPWRPLRLRLFQRRGRRYAETAKKTQSKTSLNTGKNVTRIRTAIRLPASRKVFRAAPAAMGTTQQFARQTDDRRRRRADARQTRMGRKRERRNRAAAIGDGHLCAL